MTIQCLEVLFNDVATGDLPGIIGLTDSAVKQTTESPLKTEERFFCGLLN